VSAVIIHLPPTRLMVNGVSHNVVTRRRAAIPNNGTKVGDWVRVCWDAHAEHHAPKPSPLPRRVMAVCRFRGVMPEGLTWIRAWVRVKGGAT
jgi:methyl coenzyme M reductase gamma subunit